MENLNGIVSFVRTAEAMSFVAASRTLGISASAVGKNVANLERDLHVRLFHRSTRKLSLTEEGKLFYERCRRILDDLTDARAMLSHAQQTPRGRLRVSLPTIGYRFLLPLLPEFETRYPEVKMDLDFSDRMVNVIDEGFDVVIRSGELVDSTLVSRRLFPFRFLVCASPDYLRRRGIPRAPADLEQHACIHYRFATTGKRLDWSMSGDPTWTQLRLPESLICNNMEAVLMATIRGHGMAYMPDFLVRNAVAAGALQSVLDAQTQDTGQFWALWPTSRHLSPKIRVFIDFLVERMNAPTEQHGEA